MMRITPQKLLVTAAFGFVVGCAPATGTGDGGEPTCTSDLDCDGTDQCHPGLGICVQDCSLDTADACPAEAPVCNEADAESGEYPLEVADPNADQAYRLLCICVDDSDCGAGETCDTATRECVAGGDAGPGPDECEVATEVEDCGEDAFCIDGQCEDACIDDDCLGEGDLCQYDDSTPEFNQCVPADDVTSVDCELADGAPAQGGDNDIVIYFVETLDDPEADGCEVGGETFPLRSYFLSIYSEEDLTTADPQDILFRPGFDAGNEKFFQDPGVVDTDISAVDGLENEYTAIAYICGSPNDAAAQIRTDTSDSNVYCFDPLAAPLP